MRFVSNYTEHTTNDASTIVAYLDKLGKGNETIDVNLVDRFLTHPVVGVRVSAVKAIGRVHTLDTIPMLKQVITNDNSSLVVREAVSSIGRIKDEGIVDILLDLLTHKDPKVICQAIRGLIYFKYIERVRNAIMQLEGHPNETVRNAIKTLYDKRDRAGKDKQHISVRPFLKNVAVNGDVLDVLRYTPDDSFHLTFTSPPYYNARDYSIYESYEAYLLFLEKVFKEVYRTTKDGRFLIVNTSPVIVPRISRAHASKRYPIPFDLNTILQDMGWEFIDDIIWMKPEYSVKNRVGGFMQHRKPLGYKPNNVTEYLMVYRKPSGRLIDWNMRQYPSEIIKESLVDNTFETTNVWQINPKSNKIHSAIFPEALCERVVKYYSYKGDLVFDPFGGSGTLARVANYLDRCFFTTEMDSRYFAYIKENLSANIYSIESKFYTLQDFIKTTK